MVLQRRRGQEDATLHITGRDVEERELALKFQKGKWTLAPELRANVTTGRTQQAILTALKDAGQALSPKKIAALVEKNDSTVRTILQRMKDKGVLQQDAEGKYFPTEESNERENNGVDGIDGVDMQRERETAVDGIDTLDGVDGVDSAELSTRGELYP